MKKVLLFVLTFISLNTFSQSFNLGRYNDFLKSHVDKEGVVNYNKVLKNIDELNVICKGFSKISPNNSWTDSEKKTYWINLYNVNILRLIAENYPIKSINYIREPFKIKFISYNGEKISLDEIEHTILRKFNDPRIHFALYATTVSSPKLRNNAYKSDTIESDLGIATSDFLNDSSKNKIGKIYTKLSQVFDWYKADFHSHETLVEFINTHSYRKLKIDTKIGYIEYDWNLVYKK
ncbi:DUF547 domain-containing protein [Flavobacteriaceae bacterium]|nr:DUF547 domain-containing protein [Flavobacteriaceae bacterium]